MVVPFPLSYRAGGEVVGGSSSLPYTGSGVKGGGRRQRVAASYVPRPSKAASMSSGRPAR